MSCYQPPREEVEKIISEELIKERLRRVDLPDNIQRLLENVSDKISQRWENNIEFVGRYPAGF